MPIPPTAWPSTSIAKIPPTAACEKTTRLIILDVPKKHCFLMLYCGALQKNGGYEVSKGLSFVPLIYVFFTRFCFRKEVFVTAKSYFKAFRIFSMMAYDRPCAYLCPYALEVKAITISFWGMTTRWFPPFPDANR